MPWRIAVSYVVAALICIIVAQSAALLALVRARRTAARERAQALAEAHTIAHDLNNSLSVILNYANFVLEDLTDGQARGEDVAEIRRAALQAGALTHSLGGSPEPRDASARLEQAPRKRRAAA
jgi:signal transduction histidine kinase